MYTSILVKEYAMGQRNENYTIGPCKSSKNAGIISVWDNAILKLVKIDKGVPVPCTKQERNSPSFEAEIMSPENTRKDKVLLF